VTKEFGGRSVVATCGYSADKESTVEIIGSWDW